MAKKFVRIYSTVKILLPNLNRSGSCLLLANVIKFLPVFVYSTRLNPMRHVRCHMIMIIANKS